MIAQSARAALLCLALLQPAAAAIAARGTPATITPSNAGISYTVFALGLLPITGSFQRFGGSVTLPTGSTGCRVQIAVEVNSLHMNDATNQKQALAPDMLDAARFPAMSFTGVCRGQTLAGRLTLHGVTRPFSLAIKRDGNHVLCTGTLARRDYGITGLSSLVSPRVRIRLNVTLPPGTR